MYCTKCGKKLDYEAKICNECIAATKVAEEAAAPVASTPYANAVSTASQNRNPYAKAQPTVGTISAEQASASAASYANAQATVGTEAAKAKALEEYTEPEVIDNEDLTPKPKGKRTFGMGKALAATIVAVIAYIISNINLNVSGAFSFLSLLAQIGGEVEIGNALDAGGTAISVILGIVTMAMGIVSICLGTISIKTFKAHKAETGVAPIPTLVLGIAGLVLGVLCVISSLELFASFIISAALGFVQNSIYEGFTNYT